MNAINSDPDVKQVVSIADNTELNKTLRGQIMKKASRAASNEPNLNLN